jgi:hypothetical protein
VGGYLTVQKIVEFSLSEFASTKLGVEFKKNGFVHTCVFLVFGLSLVRECMLILSGNKDPAQKEEAGKASSPAQWFIANNNEIELYLEGDNDEVVSSRVSEC